MFDKSKKTTMLLKSIYFRRKPVVGSYTKSVSSRIVNSKSNRRQNSSNNPTQDSKETIHLIILNTSFIESIACERFSQLDKINISFDFQAPFLSCFSIFMSATTSSIGSLG